MALASPRGSAQIIPHARCKPGDRCRIVAGFNSGAPRSNVGRIVVVVRPWRDGEAVSGIDDWLTLASAPGPAWVVTALSDGLHCHKIIDGVVVGPARKVMSMPILDARLQPLKDSEGGVEQPTMRRAPRQRGRKTSLKEVGRV
jgi:hypothetical protein